MYDVLYWFIPAGKRGMAWGLFLGMDFQKN